MKGYVEDGFNNVDAILEDSRQDRRLAPCQLYGWDEEHEE